MLLELLAAAAEADMLSRSRPRKVSAHNCGDCVRALWYGEHGFKAAPMDGSRQMAFDVGDAIEAAVTARLIALGIGYQPLGYSDTVDCPPVGRVRADGLLPDATVEIKSMAPYPFERATTGDIGAKYRAQLECEMRGHRKPRGLFLAINKGDGALHEIEVVPDDQLWDDLCIAVERARQSKMPDRPYVLATECEGCSGTGKTAVRKQEHRACGGTGKLAGGPFIPAFPCGWCGYRDECWPDLEAVTVGEKTRHRPRGLLAEQLAASLEVAK